MVETGVKYQASAIKHQKEGDSSNEEDKKINKEEDEYFTCQTVHNYNATSACLKTSTRKCQDEPWHCCRLCQCSSRKERQHTNTG